MLKTMMVAAAIAAATPAHAQDAAAIPDPHVTPGAMVSTERAPACAEVHTRRPNTMEAARRVLELYSVPWSEREICRAVCDFRTMSITDGQWFFIQGKWR